MKAYIIYHKVDFDWIASAWAVKEHIERVPHLDPNNPDTPAIKSDDIVFVPMNYGDELPISIEEMCKHPEWTSKNEVYILDFSLPRSMMLELRDHANLTWIDHHISAIAEFDEPTMPNYIDNIQGVRKVGTAACKLTYDYLNLSSILDTPAVDETFNLLAKYDVRDKSDMIEWASRILPFQYWLREACLPLNIDTFTWIIERMDEETLEDTVDFWHKLLKYLEWQRASWMKKAGTVQFIYSHPSTNPNVSHTKVEVTWLALFWPSGGSSQVFDSKRDNTIYDVMIYITYNIDKKEYAVSLYSDKDNINCANIAKSFWGGWHKWAAGFVCKELPFQI